MKKRVFYRPYLVINDSSSTSGSAAQSEAAETEFLEATKASLLQSLKMSIKELQVQYLDQESTLITTDEASDKLLATLEAIFIHGLKDSFLGIRGKGLFRSLSQRGGSGVVEGVAPGRSNSTNSHAAQNRPSPNFWTFVMVFR